jgi:hypothetical protein
LRRGIEEKACGTQGKNSQFYRNEGSGHAPFFEKSYVLLVAAVNMVHQPVTEESEYVKGEILFACLELIFELEKHIFKIIMLLEMFFRMGISVKFKKMFFPGKMGSCKHADFVDKLDKNLPILIGFKGLVEFVDKVDKQAVLLIQYCNVGVEFRHPVNQGHGVTSKHYGHIQKEPLKFMAQKMGLTTATRPAGKIAYSRIITDGKTCGQQNGAQPVAE